jgi:hypothetical protein
MKTTAAVLIISSLASAAPLVASRPPSASDPGWPRVHATRAGCRVQIYQPQIASWEGQNHLVTYVAVAHYGKGTETPVLGTVKVEADTTVALEERLVNFAALKITEANFGTAGRDKIREIVSEIEGAMPEFDRMGMRGVGNRLVLSALRLVRQ